MSRFGELLELLNSTGRLQAEVIRNPELKDLGNHLAKRLFDQPTTRIPQTLRIVQANQLSA